MKGYIQVMNPEDANDTAINTNKFTSPRYQIEMSYKGDNVIIKAKGPNYEIELKATGANEIICAKDGIGIEGFIRQELKQIEVFIINYQIYLFLENCLMKMMENKLHTHTQNVLRIRSVVFFSCYLDVLLFYSSGYRLMFVGFLWSHRLIFFCF